MNTNRTFNTETFNLLKSNPTESYTAMQIVRHTGRSFSTVRDTLNRMYEAGIIDRDLSVGLNGHSIRIWFWLGE